LGYACYIEACGIAPSNVAGSLGARAGLYEAGEIRVHPTGTVTVFTGSHAHGQGHETTFAQVVADRLGLGIEQVEIVHGDTSKILFGMGTYGSRSIAVGGTAIVKALDKIVGKGKKISKRPKRTSSTTAACSRSPAPTRRRPSVKWRSPPMCRTTIRSTSSSPA
jgi:carbon-monoxide dehydrogenase large subunit